MRPRSFNLPRKKEDILIELGVASAQKEGRKFWPDERGMAALREVAASRGDTVYIDGVGYHVKYDVMFRSKVSGGSEYPCLHLKRVDGKFAPRGYISHARVGI